MTAVPVDDEFVRLADPYRRELLAHCYRMLGSLHDAEDLVQETYVRAWRAYDKFEGRSSLRTWLHRIATTTCLTALEGKAKRPMPSGFCTPADPRDEPVPRGEIQWLEPIPDPATVVTGRESLRLAVIVAMQHLPPRQRAVLVLREVLGWRAAEVAELLDTSTAAVNSSLQRARAQLAAVAPDRAEMAEPAEHKELLDRYVAAFERKDVPAIVELLSTDACWEMPPFAEWYRGPEAIEHHLVHRCSGVPGGIRMIPVAANGQPGFAQYLRDQDGVFRAFLIQVLTVEHGRITRAANFLDPSLFPAFDLPMTVHAECGNPRSQ